MAFSTFMQALNAFELDPETKLGLLQLLSAFLRLGNITFLTRGKGASQGSSVSSEEEFDMAAKLLSIDTSTLRQAICFKPSKGTGNPTMATAEEAMSCKCSLSRFLYKRMFLYIVQMVNSRLFVGKSGCHLSLLDPFGHETLVDNSLDQLCVNYSEEKLHAFFIDACFKSEIKIYEMEGLYLGDVGNFFLIYI